MLTLLLLLAQSPTVITNANVKSVQRCNCKPSQSVMDGIIARQFVYVEPLPRYPQQVVSTGGEYGANLIRVRPMFVAYPYDVQPYQLRQPYFVPRFNYAQIGTYRSVTEDRRRPAGTR